jgi:hypothetical protein
MTAADCGGYSGLLPCSRWDVYSNVGTQGRRLDESAPLPETGFTILQHQLTVYEAGNSVPYTGKLVALAKHQVASIIDKTLKDDARIYFYIHSYILIYFMYYDVT